VVSSNQPIPVRQDFTLPHETIDLHRALDKKQAELDALSAISQSMARETNLTDLFRVVHTEIEQVLGEIDFMIALYHKENGIIEMPYACEDGKMLDIQPFPLGEGLTSILIQTGEPLRIVENVEHRMRELGAKVIGEPAKSWLGVPLIVAGNSIGALIVQDLHQENRFNESDQRLLIILAGQVAVAIRNMNLLEVEKHRGEREHLLNEISNKIRQPIDLPSILAITAYELGVNLDLFEVSVEINFQDSTG